MEEWTQFPASLIVTSDVSDWRLLTILTELSQLLKIAGMLLGWNVKTAGVATTGVCVWLCYSSTAICMSCNL
jgi:hypothetical protein